MSLTTLVFAAFVAAAVLGCQLLPRRGRNLWLLIASMGFVATWDWMFVGILAGLGCVNHLLGLWIARTERSRTRILWFGIVVNLLALIVFKYKGFFVPEVLVFLKHLGARTTGGGIQFLMPVGLSFLTLQMISYLVEVNKGLQPPENRLLDFLLYVFYFPKILSGPIERARSFLPKLKQPQSLSYDLIVRSTSLIVIGLVRKILLADPLNAMIPPDVFVHPLAYPGQILALWLVTYAFAIYNDFAGYTSIVRGVSGFFGIELTNNFALPYFSRSIAEFWNRWHISLSNWLRDYIFFPLSRALLKRGLSHNHVIHLALPPLVTMLVSGMWHGLSWNLLAWGGLHGIFLISGQLSTLWRPKTAPNAYPKWRQLVSPILTFLLVCVGWIVFRMDLVTAGQYLAGLFTPSNWIKPQFWLVRQVLEGRRLLGDWSQWGLPDPRAFVVLLPAFLLDWLQFHHRDELIFLKWSRFQKAIAIAVLVIVFLLLSFTSTGAPFVYQGF